MASTFSQNLRLELIASGSQTGVWGTTTNNNLGDLIEQAISGATDLNVTSGDITLTALNGVADQARSAVLNVTGTPGATRTITIPNVSKLYTVKNRSDSTVDIKTASGTAFSIPTLAEAYIHCDGNNGVTGRVITDGAQNTLLNTQTPFNNVALTGTPTAPTPATGDSSDKIATTELVDEKLATIVSIPTGVIMMWSGSIGDIPSGYVLCDGTNGTPNLQDRFIIGAGNVDFSPGDTGGSRDAVVVSHTHTASGSTENTNISHSHSFSGSGSTGGAGAHSHSGSTNTAGSHQHSMPGMVAWNQLNNNDGLVSGANQGFQGLFRSTSVVTNAAGDHSHSLSINGVGDHSHSVSVSGTVGSSDPVHSHTFNVTTGSAGESGVGKNMPPYYALCFIMKT